MKFKRSILVLFFVGITLSLSAQDADKLLYMARVFKDKEAMYNLGNCYLNGTGGVSRDYRAAASWYYSAAKKKYPPAQAALARCYIYGTGVMKDYKQASKLALKSAKKGCGAGYYVIAIMYKNGYGGFYKNDNYYLKYLKYASDLGDPEAQTELAYMYFLGNDSPRVNVNEKLAVDLFKSAAAKGDEHACFALGLLYDGGVEGILKDDPKLAFQYMTAALEGGVESAYYQCGRMKLFGIGCDEDYDEAFKYLSYAAYLEDEKAYKLLGDMYYYGHGVDEDDDEAVRWYQKAVDAGYENAYSCLADMYMYGYGVKENYSKAFQLYKKAADAGDSEGYYGLGRCYQYGYGTSKSMNLAVRYYEKAADEGDDHYAQYNLYFIYKDGDGVTKNTSKAIQYLREAADAGYAPAQYSLGFEYGIGEILHREDGKALEYMTKAADNNYMYARAVLGVFYYRGDWITDKDYDKAFYNMDMVAFFDGYGCSDEVLSEMYRDLAACYRFGRGTSVDYEQAAYYTKKAAEYGDEDSRDIMNLLGGQTIIDNKR